MFTNAKPNLAYEEVPVPQTDNSVPREIAQREAWNRSMQPTIRRCTSEAAQWIRGRVAVNKQHIDKLKILAR